MGAARRMLAVLERRPRIESNPAAGLQLAQQVDGVTLDQAEFSYPSRPGGKVLQRLCLSLRAGERVGLVGQSGCGKSTVLQLIQRLYDLDAGDLDYSFECWKVV